VAGTELFNRFERILEYRESEERERTIEFPLFAIANSLIFFKHTYEWPESNYGSGYSIYMHIDWAIALLVSQLIDELYITLVTSYVRGRKAFAICVPFFTT
jgi:hypothetical protein